MLFTCSIFGRMANENNLVVNALALCIPVNELGNADFHRKQPLQYFYNSYFNLIAKLHRHYL